MKLKTYTEKLFRYAESYKFTPKCIWVWWKDCPFSTRHKNHGGYISIKDGANQVLNLKF